MMTLKHAAKSLLKPLVYSSSSGGGGGGVIILRAFEVSYRDKQEIFISAAVWRIVSDFNTREYYK
jgi:hypothetical protein